MEANSKISLPELEVTLGPVEPERVSGGAPREGLTELGTHFGVDLGVWEMSEGVATDTEEDELFVVLSGSATLTFAQTGEQMTLTTGDVVHLAAGTPTLWDVHEKLRKMYVTPVAGQEREE